MTAIPDQLLSALSDDLRVAVQSDDDAVAARGMLDAVEGIPPLSATVALRSRWLALVSARLMALGDVPDALDVRLLGAIARTAFSAHETTPAMTATEQAIARAEELGASGLVALLIARRIPWILGELPEEAAQQLAEVDALLPTIADPHVHALVSADASLARAAIAAQASDWDGLRQALAGVGRAAIPRDERLHFYAFTAQMLLAQQAMRTGQRVEAVRTLMETARIANDLEAWAELANVQTLVAAYAVRTGSFETAISHAESALAAMEHSTLAHAQHNPWLGLAVDISAESDFAGAIRSLAESVVQSLDRNDRLAFLVSSCALVAFYLVSDRAPEALDALNEAIEAAQEMGDGAGESVLRSVSESLLRYMGVLQ